MTDQQRIAEIAARCERATPGPWEYFDNGFDGEIRSTTARSKYIGEPKIICGGEPCEGRIDNCPDAHFIAHAREDIPYLLDLLAEREKEIGRLQSIINSPAVAYMSSPIGDLPIDSTGMRKAVDEIARLTELHKREVIITGEYAQRVINLRAEIARLTEAQRWIPVSERLPEEGQRVLVWNCASNPSHVATFTSGGRPENMWHYNDGYDDPACWVDGVTHWMPLPSAEGLHDEV